MMRLGPNWSARRLNEALMDGRPFLELDPSGEIAPFSGSSPESVYPAELQGGMLFVFPLMPTADLFLGLSRLPALLALLSINPEPWCATIIRVADFGSVGPFLDYANPLWEWMLRAAKTGRVRFVSFSSMPWLISFQSPRLIRLTDDSRIPLPELVHDRKRPVPPWLRATLDDFELRQSSAVVSSAADAVAVSAGLLEMHDFVASHELAQSVEGRGRNRAGDYWHAIHHRREPDPRNAKYWFRQVGRHPIHESLVAAAGTLISGEAREVRESLAPVLSSSGWDSFAFVDVCTRAIESKDAKLAWAARKLQFLEMTFLLAGTYQDATS